MRSLNIICISQIFIRDVVKIEDFYNLLYKPSLYKYFINKQIVIKRKHLLEFLQL